MERASYRRGIAWVAEHSSPGDARAEWELKIAHRNGAAPPFYTFSLLLAELFGVEPSRVARDVRRYHHKHGIA